jgi:hypothetical protein
VKSNFLKAHEWLLLSGDACAFILGELDIDEAYRAPLRMLGYIVATVVYKFPQPEHFASLRALTIRYVAIGINLSPLLAVCMMSLKSFIDIDHDDCS